MEVRKMTSDALVVDVSRDWAIACRGDPSALDEMRRDLDTWRVSGAAVLMVTLCIGLLLFEAASRMPWLTGGDNGLQGIEMWPLLGLFEFDLFAECVFQPAFDQIDR